MDELVGLTWSDITLQPRSGKAPSSTPNWRVASGSCWRSKVAESLRPGFRHHHFMGNSIDLPDNLTEAQLDGRVRLRCGHEPEVGKGMRPVEAWSEQSAQLFECVRPGELWSACRSAAPATGGLVTPHQPPQAVATVRWEDLEDRADRCPRCLHWWVSHGVPGEDGYGCTPRANSIAEQLIVFCGCTFAEGNPVTPRQVRIWHEGTLWPLAPWDRADCGHRRRGPIRPDRSQECLDCGAVLVSDG